MARILALIWLALVASPAFAANGDHVDGYAWYVTSVGSGTLYWDGAAAGQAAIALETQFRLDNYCHAGGNNYNIIVYSSSVTYSGPATGAGNIGWKCSGGSYAGNHNASRNIQRTACTTNCPQPPVPDCEADSWIHSEVAADTAAAAEASIAAGDCVEGCTVKGVQLWSPGINLGSGLRWSLGVQLSGQVCGAKPQTPSPQEPEGPPDKELCKSTPGAGTACAGPYGENCGYLNGKFVCLGKTDPDECWINGDGSRWCGESAPMPPAPDNGTRGEKATPNDQVAAESPSGSTTTYYYYNTTTMAASSQASDSGANPNRPGSTDPGTEPTPVACEGDNCGGQGGGAEDGGASWCDAPPTCSDGGSIYCAQLHQQWRAMCPQVVTESEALQAIGATDEEMNGVAEPDAVDIGSLDAVGPLGAAACPAPISVTIMGQSLSLDIWQRGCDMALLFAPFVMAMGYLMAGLLFLRGLN